MRASSELLTRYREEGFVILRDVLQASQIDALRAALQPYLDLDVQGRNNFAFLLKVDFVFFHPPLRVKGFCLPFSEVSDAHSQSFVA